MHCKGVFQYENQQNVVMVVVLCPKPLLCDLPGSLLDPHLHITILVFMMFLCSETLHSPTELRPDSSRNWLQPTASSIIPLHSIIEFSPNSQTTSVSLFHLYVSISTLCLAFSILHIRFHLLAKALLATPV